MSLTAYQRNQQVTDSPKSVEYRLFAQITRGLIVVDELGDKRKIQDLLRALDKNLQLWRTLQSDCASEQNTLAPTLRAGIISLSIWVEKYTRQVVQGTGQLKKLIAVNRSIMEGLAA